MINNDSSNWCCRITCKSVSSNGTENSTELKYQEDITKQFQCLTTSVNVDYHLYKSKNDNIQHQLDDYFDRIKTKVDDSILIIPQIDDIDSTLIENIIIVSYIPSYFLLH